MGRCIKEDEEHVSTCSEEKKIEIGLFWEIKMSIHLKAIFTYCWREFFSTPLWRYNDDHRGVRAVIWSKSVPIWMSGKQLDPPCFPPPSLYGDLYFWIVSRCFLFFFLSLACRTCPRPAAHTAISTAWRHHILFWCLLRKTGCIPSSGRSEEYPQWEKLQETAGDVCTLQHSINVCGFGRVNCVGVWDI